jgi:hypothetical protein
MQSNGQAFKPGTQERNTAISIFPLLYCGIAKLRRILYERQITIYETNNTPLSEQYRHWMHSSVNQLRQHADHHTKQGEHARGLRI